MILITYLHFDGSLNCCDIIIAIVVNPGQSARCAIQTIKIFISKFHHIPNGVEGYFLPEFVGKHYECPWAGAVPDADFVQSKGVQVINNLYQLLIRRLAQVQTAQDGMDPFTAGNSGDVIQGIDHPSVAAPQQHHQSFGRVHRSATCRHGPHGSHKEW